MKALAAFCFSAGLGFLVSGCESISERVADRFKSDPPQTKLVPSEKKAVFYASQKALKRMGFEVTRTALAQGSVNARSSIRDTAIFGAGRQFLFEIQISATDAGSNIRVKLIELLEGDFKAGATGKLLQTHGLYDSFFSQTEHALREESASSTPP